MTGSSPSIGARPPGKKRQFPFGLVMLLFGFIGGFFTGTWAIKRAMTGPGWVQGIFGIKMNPPAAPTNPTNPVIVNTPVAVNPSPPAGPVQQPVTPVTPGTSSGMPANPDIGSGTPSGTSTPPVGTSGTSGTGNPVSPSHTDEQGFTGKWEIVDEIKATGNKPSKITSSYTFNPDGTGEFDTNGKKMYDLHWEIDQDYLIVNYDMDPSDTEPKWSTKYRWSVDGSRSILTLVPEGKDARAALYNSTGPGVYRRK